MGNKRDILVTWPITRPLSSYLIELDKAKEADLVINYRVRNPPSPTPQRCYVCHGGIVVGWNPVIEVTYKDEGEVARVKSDAFAGFWPAGWYVVRKPEFHAVPDARQIEITGFRGWRWFDRRDVENA